MIANLIRLDVHLLFRFIFIGTQRKPRKRWTTRTTGKSMFATVFSIFSAVFCLPLFPTLSKSSHVHTSLYDHKIIALFFKLRNDYRYGAPRILVKLRFLLIFPLYSLVNGEFSVYQQACHSVIYLHVMYLVFGLESEQFPVL